MFDNLQQQLIALGVVVTIMIITPVVFIALDYWAGIRKARKRGDAIRSDRMKRTIDKISKYYNCIFAMMVLDAIQISGFVYLHLYQGWNAWTFPLFTLLSVMFVAGVEIKSIYEPADVKESRDIRQTGELLKQLIAHRSEPEEIAAALARFLSEYNDEQAKPMRPKKPRRNGTGTNENSPKRRVHHREAVG